MATKDNLNQALNDMFGVGKIAGKVQELEKQGKAAVAEKTERPAKAEKAAPSVDYTANRPSTGKKDITFIAEETIIEGSIRAKGDVEVAGQINGDIISTGCVTLYTAAKGNISAKDLNIPSCKLTGDISCEGRVVIGPTAVVQGNIAAKELYCSGTVLGDVELGSHLNLESTAFVNGKIATGTMSMVKGARISGGIDMREPAQGKRDGE